jgi:ribosomal protein S18 acetylase RimI-like enzyme
MTNDLHIRNASVNDIPFLTESIIAAEKSGSGTLSYSTLFGLTEEETKNYIGKMLQEEVDGCELSVSSFLIAEKNETKMAAVAAWIEEADGISSNLLKRNLLSYTLPKECFQKSVGVTQIVQDLYIREEPGTIQIGIVYVSPLFRGVNLAAILIEEQIKRLLTVNPDVKEICVQVFSDNQPAIAAYRKTGFAPVLEKTSPDHNALLYFPSGKKLLMTRKIAEEK